MAVRQEKKPVDKEIIIDVPLALKLAAQVRLDQCLLKTVQGSCLQRDQSRAVHACCL